MTDVTIRLAGDGDEAALAGLRRAWCEEQAGGQIDDDGFDDAFTAWLAAESGRRVVFLAERDGTPVGMVNATVFERMPRPGREGTRWAYLGNAYVRPAQRGAGVGALLVEELVAWARERGCARIVLSPTSRSVPFYERHGFGPATMLMARVL